MKSIREYVFETNSSSCHSLTFSTRGSATKTSINLKVKGDSYQWHYANYVDPQNKFSYWLNAFEAEVGIQLNQRMAKLKKLDKYYITKYLPFEENCGPCDVQIYEEVLKETADKLEAVLKKLEDFGVRLFIESREGIYYDTVTFKDVDDYIKQFKSWNEPTTIDRLCEGNFEFLVDLSDGIDHQSAPGEDSDCEYLAKMSADEVVDWVLGDGYFETGNDND